MARATFSNVDRNLKPTSMRIQVLDAVADALLTAIADALAGVLYTNGVGASKTIETVVEVGDDDPVADVDNDRGIKLLLRFQDSTNAKKFNHEIGTFNAAVLPSSTTDFLDLTAGVGLALKDAFDAAYRSPYGNAGVLLSAQKVTREES
jgi:hypothetical protein